MITTTVAYDMKTKAANTMILANTEGELSEINVIY